jgi:hypothetical protein
MYVIIFYRHDCDGDIDSHHEYGMFDVNDKRGIYRKHQQRSDSKRTTTTNTN